MECLSNTHLSEHFKELRKELEPKSLEEIYESLLENSSEYKRMYLICRRLMHIHRVAASNTDSARANLAGSFVNSFVNAGFGNDKVMVDAPEGDSWIYKNKDHGMMSAATSLGLSLLWDTDVGLSRVDRHTFAGGVHQGKGYFNFNHTQEGSHVSQGGCFPRNRYTQLQCTD